MLTAEEINIANQSLAGMSQTEIAQANGYANHSPISRRLAKDEVQEYIRQAKEKLIQESLPTAVSNFKHAIDNYTAKDADAQLKEHGHKNSLKLMEDTGILVSRTPSLTINGDVQVTPIIAQIIQQFGRSLASSDDVIEAEPSNK